MIIGIDHGYYAIKTRNCSFPAGITPFGDREPYTRQNVLAFGGCFFVCGSGGALLSFRRVNRPALGIGSCAVLFGISYFTEKMKIFIEGRHYAFAECLESFVFAALGWLCMALFFSLKSRKRSCYVSEEIKSAESDHHHH